MRFTFDEGGEKRMKIISETADGFLVDMSHKDLCCILDKARYSEAGITDQYGNSRRRELLGKEVRLADIWTKLHDQIRLESDLAALKIQLTKMLDCCERAKPIADEVAEIIKPKKAA